MANFNKVILAGNLTRDPQLSYLPNNTAVCEFGMAINRKWKSQSGEMKDEVCFVDLTAFGRSGETINQYMKKGQPLLVDGRLKYHQWEGKDGQKKSRLTVVVDSFQFLGGPTGGRGASSGEQSSRSSGSGGRVPVEEMPPMDEAATAPTGEDIPF